MSLSMRASDWGSQITIPFAYLHVAVQQISKRV